MIFSYLNRLALLTFTEMGPQFSNQDSRLGPVIEKAKTCNIQVQPCLHDLLWIWLGHCMCAYSVYMQSELESGASTLGHNHAEWME